MAAAKPHRRREADAASGRMPRAYIGCSGWRYPSWRGPFYPDTLSPSHWLGYYASHFATVEINNTFYRLPEKSTFAAWRAATPDGFTMAVKASGYLTHRKRLRAPAEPLARLFRRASALGPRLGPILYQLPSTLRHDALLLRRFLTGLATQSARLFDRHTKAGRPRVRRLRHVIEFRDVSWYRPDVFEAIRAAGAAVCLHDMPGSAIFDAPDSPFVYVRFHGTEGKYSGSYSDRVLSGWARRLRSTLAGGHDVYAYFNNDLGGTAVENARTLIRYVCRS
jgi:uncharacterized protein YecE (DUF72 family)